MSEYDLTDPRASRTVVGRPASKAAPVKDAISTNVQRDPTEAVSCRTGDASCAKAHASVLNRTASPDLSMERSLLRFQAQYGNRYVGQVLSRRAAEPGGDNLADVERSIDTARGGGQGLDHAVRNQMES